MPKTDLRVVKTQRIIQNAFFELLSEKELSKITIAEICRIAQVNRKTFYRHYESIGDLINEFENTILGGFSKNLTPGNTVLNIGAVIRGISTELDQRRDYFMRMMKHNPDLFSNGKIKAILCRMITVSLKGSYSDTKAIAAAAEYSAAGILALYSAWIEGKCEGDLDFLTDIAVKMTMSALTVIEK